MNCILIYILFPVLLFPNIQCEKLDLLKYYEESVNNLISHRLNDSKYCESILLPTESTLKKSLESTFLNARSGTISEEKYRIDLCCRSLFKCDAHKRIELNQTTEIHISFCGCVQSFKTCLKSLNTSLSTEVAFIHAVNKTKCFSKVHPIIKCIKFEKYSEAIVQLLNLTDITERDKYFKRCVKYELDQSREEDLQMFDIPFNDYTVVIGVADEESMENLRHFDEKEKFDSPEEISMFIMGVLNVAINSGCDIYDTFFDDIAPTINIGSVPSNHKMKIDNNKLDIILTVFKKLTKSACNNVDIINDAMKHPSSTVPSLTTTAALPASSTKIPATSSASGLGETVLNIYGGTHFHFH